MSNSGFVARWQRELRDDPEITDLEWKVGMALSTYADQYTDAASGLVAGEHARPGVVKLSRAAHVSRNNVGDVLESLAKRGLIELSSGFSKRSGKFNEYRLCLQQVQSCVSNEDKAVYLAETKLCHTGETQGIDHVSTHGSNSSVRGPARPAASPVQVRTARKAGRTRQGMASSLAGKSPVIPQPRKNPDGWWVEDDG